MIRLYKYINYTNQTFLTQANHLQQLLTETFDLKDGSSTSKGAFKTAIIIVLTEYVIIAKGKQTTQDKNIEEG